jgi:transcription elongation factor Elf1
MSNNPLQKFYRQPKIFISLPSKGLYYNPGDIQGDSNNLPVFAMTGMDEIIMKTPDALFNGEATTRVIESCCPYIKDAKNIPSLDIDTLLVSIRMATFGEHMTITHTCKNCGTENDFDVDLRTVIDHYSTLTFDNQVEVGGLAIEIKPLSYQQLTDFNVENFKLQKMLAQLGDTDIEESVRKQYVEQIYDNLAEIQVKIITSSIESIRTPDGEVVTDQGFIIEWLRNINVNEYSLIKAQLEKNKDKWAMPKQDVKCTECGTEDSLTVTMDQSNFFVRA